MRVLAVLVGLLASVAGSFGAYAAIRAVGPGDRSGEFGYGDAAVAPPGGGTLLQSRNFARVVAALRRDLGEDATLQSLDVKWTEATAMAQVGKRLRYVDIDASGRTRVRDGDAAGPGARVPLKRIDATALDRIVAAAAKENSAAIEHITLAGNTREWNVYLSRGEPDQLVANLDGRGVRLSGEPNPEPVGGGPDSMLRAKNLERVFAAARKEGDRIRSLDIRPDRVSFELDSGRRVLALDYGYDAQLTYRDVRARTGADQATIGFDRLDAGAVQRMARSRHADGLKNVQYVLFSAPRSLAMYLTSGHDPPYLTADLHGRHVTWPGRAQ